MNGNTRKNVKSFLLKLITEPFKRCRKVLASTRDAVQRLAFNHGRSKVHAEFLEMSDEILEKAGISRVLLEKGVEYWPWSIESNKGSMPVSRVDIGELVGTPKIHTTSEKNLSKKSLLKLTNESSIKNKTG